jgi:hypothetical protein
MFVYSFAAQVPHEQFIVNGYKMFFPSRHGDISAAAYRGVRGIGVLTLPSRDAEQWMVTLPVMQHERWQIPITAWLSSRHVTPYP